MVPGLQWHIVYIYYIIQPRARAGNRRNSVRDLVRRPVKDTPRSIGQGRTGVQSADWDVRGETTAVMRDGEDELGTDDMTLILPSSIPPFVCFFDLTLFSPTFQSARSFMDNYIHTYGLTGVQSIRPYARAGVSSRCAGDARYVRDVAGCLGVP